MRIGFDARWYNDSGVGNYVVGLLQAFAECAHDIHIVAYESPNHPIPGLDQLAITRVRIHSPKYSVQEQVELSYRCRHDRLDVFHSPFYLVPFAAACPVITTIHDLIPFLFTINSRPKQWIVKMGYRASVLRASRIIAVSGTTAKDLRRLLGVPVDKISVVHNASSSEYFHARATSDELTYLCRKYGLMPPFVVVSNPHNWRTKNVGAAFEVLTSVKAAVGNCFQTAVYGSGPNVYGPAGGQVCTDVIQMGFISSEDLGILFRHAQVFLLTSLYEGFGLPLVEAMSCGCPVVTSNAGSLAEVAGDGAWTFDPMNVSGMAGAVATLLRDADERERWRARAIARASNFSWRKAAEQTVAVYRQVAAHHSFGERVRSQA